jgi:hypothetical protein
VESVVLVASRCWESIERARLTRALLASEERLAFSMKAAELGTFYCPIPLDLIIWNAKCKEHFWLPPDAHVPTSPQWRFGIESRRADLLTLGGSAQFCARAPDQP